MALLIAAQRDERERVLSSIDAAIDHKLAAANAAIVASYAAQRHAAQGLPPAERRAALSRLVDQQAAEVARVSQLLADERRYERQMALARLLPAQKAARRALSISNRRERMGFAIFLHTGRGRDLGAGDGGSSKAAHVNISKWRGPRGVGR